MALTFYSSFPFDSGGMMRRKTPSRETMELFMRRKFNYFFSTACSKIAVTDLRVYCVEYSVEFMLIFIAMKFV